MTNIKRFLTLNHTFLTRLDSLSLVSRQSVLGLLLVFLTAFSSNIWGADTEYTFSSKSWAAAPSSWTSGGDGNGYTAGQGVQVTTTTTGANAISPKSFTNVTKIVVTYNTNKSGGAGSIAIKIGSNSEVSNSVAYSGSGDGRSANYTTTFNFSPAQSGTVKLTVNTTTNSIWVKSITITEASGSTITVSYDANGGSGTMTSQTGSSSYTVKTNGFTAPSGGTFTGWNTAANGSGTAYAAGATISESATLYAQWKYKVRFYTASGTYTDITETTAHAGVTPPSMEATCGDWSFLGWSTTQRTSDVTTATSCVELSAGKYYPLNGTTVLYPIYTRMESGGGGTVTHTLTKNNTSWSGYTSGTQDDDQGYTWSYNAAGTNESGTYYFGLNKNAANYNIGSPTFSGNVTSIKAYIYNASSTKTRNVYICSSNSDAQPTSGDLGSATIAASHDGEVTISTSGTFSQFYIYVSDALKFRYVEVIVSSGTPHYYSYPSCVACSDPSLDFASASLTKYVGDAKFTATFTGTNPLSAPITYSSSNSTCAEVNSSTGEVTIKRSTIDGSPVTITANLAATGSDPCQKAKSISYTLIIKNKIQWFSNEVEITSGAQTTEAFYNGSITAIPSTPSVPSACSTKSFVGWTTIADWDSDEAPDPLYPDLASFSSLKVRNNMTFYAVFASTTTGDPVSTLTQTLQYDTWNYTGTTTNKDTYRMFGDGAYIYSAAFDLSKLSQVVVCGGTFGGDSYSDISIRSASGTEWATESFTSTNAKKEYTITSSTSLSGTQALRIYSESGNGTTTGVRISKVEIYEMVATTVGTAYVTKCCTDWDDPTLTYSKNSIEVGESDATLTKSGTEHGTLTFFSSNDAIATVNASGTVHAVSPGNVTITASWSKSGSYCSKEIPINFTITGDVTVTFDANGGSGSMASQVVPYATSTVLNTMSGLSKAGMTFVGWNTAADGSGTSYANGASVKLTTNTTLYAQWGTTCTITLHRNGETEAITVLSSDIPYTLPTAEADYCDAWQFDGWSAGSAVANNSDSYIKVTQATAAEDAHFYAVYRGNGSQADAYVRIAKTADLEANKQYIFVGLNSGTKYVMPNDFDYEHHNIVGVQIDEDGKDYYLKATIETSHSGCVYYIKGSTDAWYIQNKNSSSRYINTSVQDFYTTTTSHDTYTITPTGLFWTVYNNYGSSCYGSKPYLEFYKSGGYYLFAKANDTYGSAALQIYKLDKVQLYKYTSTPSGEGCSLPCDPSGAEFTYPSMEKSTASANFTNTVIYTQKRNTTTPAYTSSNTDVARIVNPVTGEVQIEGKGKATITMAQSRDNTDPSHPICGITLSYELTVTDPSLEVVEVTEDDKLIIEHDFDGITEASVDSSKVDLKGIFADDIFISKYYEAASHMKLFALYNGTEHSIDLSQLRVRSGSSDWGDHGVVTLSQHPKIAADYPDFQLPSLTEIIFWSNTEGQDNNAQLCSCVSMEIDGKTYDYDDMKAERVPGWYHVETGTGITRFNFNGDDGLILERSTDNFETWTVIDLLGAGTKAAPVTPTGSGNGVVHVESRDNTTSSDLNDTPGGYYWDATSAAGKILSTNRFYLMRLSNVKSGQDAVEKNTDTFVTLGEEWTGRGIGGGSTMVDFCSSGELFSEVAQYDYAKYYTDYVPYADKWAAYDNEDGTFTIQFNAGELAKLSCKKLQITVKDAIDNSKTAQVEYHVPIIVKSGSKVTTDELFYTHDKDECKVCDVAILDGAVLTKSKPSSPAEVAADRDQVYNIDIYGGGELYVPSGTTYTVNTLTIRSKGDAVGVVDVQGTLKRNNYTLIHSKRFHNAGADWRWYYFSLPYDCNVNEVTFSNGDPALHGVDFEIDWYDGASRASSQANGNWRSIATHPDYPNIIKAGYGYTIAVEEKTGHTNVSLVFPMANFTEATQINVPVGNWGAGDDGITVNHKGWNVVGNPFLTRYKAQEGLDINGELRTGMLVFEGGGWTQTDNGVNYATVPINGGQSGYSQEALTNRNFDPFQSFIIQVGGDAERNDLAVQLKNAYKNKRSIVMRKDSDMEVEEKTPVWLRLNLSNANGETDQTTVLISDNYTAEYDMQRDLAKWRGTSYRYYTCPVLASVYGGHELAFDALPDSIVADRVPLTYYSRNAGTMRFELSNSYNWQALEEVILYDAQKNTQHNLLTNGAYEFQSASGETGNRFSISARVNRHKAPTIITGTDLIDAKNVILTVQDHSLLLNGLEESTTVYVFDMLGRLVGRQSGQTFMRFNVPATGVYNVRLEGKQTGVTLRAIVK